MDEDGNVELLPLIRDSKAAYTAEQHVIAGVVRDPERMGIVALEPRHFSDGPHKRLWETLMSLHAEGAPMDLIAVMERLEDAGYREDCSYLGELLANCLDTNWTFKAQLLWRYGERTLVFEQVRRALRNRDEAEIVRIGEDIQQRLAKGAKRVVLAPVSIAYQSMVDEWTESRQRPKLTWGISDLDRGLKPLEPTRLYVIAARPRMGKTAMGIHIAVANATLGRTVGIISLEQSMEELTARLLCNLSGCCYEWVRGDEPAPEPENTLIEEAKVRLCKLPIVLNDATPMSIGQLQTWARTMVHRDGCELLIVDYVQKVGAAAKERHMEIAYVAMGLKDIARQLKVPVIALAQANRDAEGKPPTMANIRDSGFIEQEADQIVALHRKGGEDEGELSDECELIVLKNRHGRGDFIVRAHYRGECFRFEDGQKRFRR